MSDVSVPLAVSLQQAGRLLGIHPKTVVELLKRGELRGRKVTAGSTGGSRWLVEYQSLVDWIGGR